MSAHQFPEVKPAPSRFRNTLSKFAVRRSNACRNCHTCAEVCPYGVHTVEGGRIQMPQEHFCIGPDCRRTDHFCVDKCPAKALSVVLHPGYRVLGDYRWTADLLLSTWFMSAYGRPPVQPLETQVGLSGGGFDRLRLVIPPEPPRKIKREDIDTSVLLNRRGDGRPELRIAVPHYGGGMSFGSISLTTMLGRMRFAEGFGTLCCTGEGGYPDAIIPLSDHVITQVATGLFGVREETIKRVPMVEFKYAQGAKPGLGGHLLGDKVTPDVARMRQAVVGSALFSPFPFHSVYSIEDHKKHLDWIKVTNERAVVSAKVSTPTDVDMVAVGSYHAGAHVIHLDGSYGGTGAAPDIAKKNIAMPIEYAIPKVHRFLESEGLRDKITVIASGGIRTPDDMIKAICLGADAVVTGTSEMVAFECLRCQNCESGRGCARGIATTDPELSQMYTADWAFQRLVNMFTVWRERLIDVLQALGLTSVAELAGRTEYLEHLDYERE